MSGLTRVVVLGGGYSGTAAAKVLDRGLWWRNDIELILIDDHEDFVHKIGGLRASVEDDWQEKVVIPRDRLLRYGQVKVGSIQEVTNSEVTLTSGEIIPFDYCILATGSRNHSPGEPPAGVTSTEDIIKFYQDNKAAVQKAENITIVGGGVVGVELAGEIKSHYPSKEVTLLHSGESLIDAVTPALPTQFTSSLHNQLASMGVKILTKTSVELDQSEISDKPMLSGTRTLKTSSGEDINTDLVISCMGATPNTGSFPREWLTSCNLVKVDDKLRVVDADGKVQSNIFAVGDITDIAENKLAFSGARQGMVAAKNVMSEIRGFSWLKSYTPRPDRSMMIVPLGPNQGESLLPRGVAGPIVTSRLKGNNLLVGPAWRIHNSGSGWGFGRGMQLCRDTGFGWVRNFGWGRNFSWGSGYGHEMCFDGYMSPRNGRQFANGGGSEKGMGSARGMRFGNGKEFGGDRGFYRSLDNSWARGSPRWGSYYDRYNCRAGSRVKPLLFFMGGAAVTYLLVKPSKPSNSDSA